MLVTHRNSVRIIAPLAVVGALLFAGCSSSTAPVDDSSASVEVSDPASTATGTGTGTGITSLDDVRYGSIDSDDPEFNAAIEELVLALNAAAAPGLLEININAHGPDRVGINLLTDSTDGTVTAAQVTSVLDVLVQFAPPSEVREYTIGGFNKNFGSGEILTAGAEAGVKAEFLDDMDQKVKIPGDQIKNAR